MASDYREERVHLINDIKNAPYKYNFYRLVNILERLFPESDRVGMSFYPHLDLVRFNSTLSMSFPASDVVNFEDISTNGFHQFKLDVSFMSLYGMFGPMPYTDTEYIMDLCQSGDDSLKNFINRMSERIIGLLYRAQKKQKLYLETKSIESSLFSKCIFSLSGFNDKASRQDFPCSQRNFLYLTTLFLKQFHSVSGLKMILLSLFSLNVKIESFQGAWWHIESSTRTILSSKPQGNALGKRCIIGRYFWDQSSGIIIKILNLNFDKYMHLLPKGSLHVSVRDTIDFYINDFIDVRFHLTIDKTQIKPQPLGKNCKLGYLAWLETKNPNLFDNRVNFFVIKVTDDWS